MQLEDGAASGSFGMNVAASMCGIPEDIMVNAEAAAKGYEHIEVEKVDGQDRNRVKGADFTARLSRAAKRLCAAARMKIRRRRQRMRQQVEILNIVYAMIDAV